MHILPALLFVLTFQAFSEKIPEPMADSKHAVETKMEIIKPLSYKKQSRKIRSYKSFRLALPYLLIGLGFATGLFFLWRWLWPSGILGQILLSGAALTILVGGWFLLFLIYVYANPATSNDLRALAQARLKGLCDQLLIDPQHLFLPKDEGHRFNLAFNQDTLLLVDYKRNRGFVIPRSKLSNVQEDYIKKEEISFLSSDKSGDTTLLLSKRATDSQLARVVRLRFELKESELSHIELIYEGISERSPSVLVEEIKAKMKIAN